MDDAVQVELDRLLGYMRACQMMTAGIDSGDMTGPEPPGPADYVRAMTWAQAQGALQALEHLRLITHEEREGWERDASALVERPS